MSEQPSSAQDFELRSCKIFPNDGRPPINVGLSLINYFIYSECVTTPFISSRMEIVDGGGLLNAVPISWWTEYLAFVPSSRLLGESAF